MKSDLPMPCEPPQRCSQGSIFKTGLLILLLAAMFSACSGFNLPGISPTPTPSLATPTPTAETPSPVVTPTQPATPQVFIIWLPPLFDPALATPASNLLADRLSQFEEQNPGVQIIVRVKSVTGTSSLLNSLSSTAPVAPAVMPSVIALPREDMEIAALKGLIFPLDEYSQAMASPDWYDYARELSMVQGSTLCLPFAGDALALVYRPLSVGTPADDWDGMINQGNALAFNYGDPQALLTLALYLSAGGRTENDQQRPTLQLEALEQVFTLYDHGVSSGFFPGWLSTLTESPQAWQAYSEQRVNLAVTWSSNYLSILPADTNIAPLPGLTGAPVSLARSWNWCISEPDSARREIAIKLAEFLVESTFQTDWTAAAGYLPTRPTALAGWSNQSLRTTISNIVLPAHALPGNDELFTLGPILQDSASQIMRRQMNPVQAAQSAVQHFETP